MLEMNINDADCMDDNFNHEIFIDCLRKILLYIKDNEQFIGHTIIDENKFDKVYETIQQGIYIWTPWIFISDNMKFYDIRKYT